MDSKDTIKQLISETPKYMTHVTVGIWVLQNLLRETEELERRVQQLENERRKPNP